MGLPVRKQRRFRHKKRGTTYQIVDDGAVLEVDGSTVVVYIADHDGQVWVRPYDEFFGGRFEEVIDDKPEQTDD